MRATGSAMMNSHRWTVRPLRRTTEVSRRCNQRLVLVALRTLVDLAEDPSDLAHG